MQREAAGELGGIGITIIRQCEKPPQLVRTFISYIFIKIHIIHLFLDKKVRLNHSQTRPIKCPHTSRIKYLFMSRR